MNESVLFNSTSFWTFGPDRVFVALKGRPVRFQRSIGLGMERSDGGPRWRIGAGSLLSQGPWVGWYPVTGMRA